jgi:penicillin-binding protein 1A
MAKKRQPRKRNGGRVWRRIVGGGALVLLVAGGVAGWITYREISANLPPVDSLLHYELPVATRVYAADGTLLGEFYTEKRYLVPIARIPPVVRDAFIAAEDAHFYRHRGVDVFGIVRAAVANFTAGEVVQGGSTITQQVVKALLLSPEKSFKRKAKEILLALRLERQLSKDEILYLYLNLIYLGNGAYGVGAAAEEYFGKDVGDLGLAEAALLAGLPQAPSRYSPVRHWKRAKYRQRYVLERMAREHVISWDEAEQALQAPIHLADHGNRTPSYLAAPYFVEHVRRILEERYGGTALHNAGLNVYTTVDLADERAAEEILRSNLRQIDQGRSKARPLRRLSNREAERFLAAAQATKDTRTPAPGRPYRGLVLGAENGGYRVQVDRFVGRLIATEDASLPKLAANDLVSVRRLAGSDDAPTFAIDTEPQIEGALVSIDLTTGYVKALVGGYDFRRSQFNRATQALRQPGSAFKPFVFSAALDRGYTPTSVIVDEPVFFPGFHQVWAPSNYDHKFIGPTTLRNALALSRNVVTVKLASNIGLNYLVDYLPRFGFSRPFEHNMAISLGAAEVTPLELTRAYSVFANQGRRLDPLFITRITDPHGALLEEFRPSSEPVISPETAYLVTSMLKSVVQRGTGRRVLALGRPAAGKTGTTNDFHDAWFIGFTPELVTGVWVGYDSERSLGAKQTGGRVAAPIFLSYMQAALGDAPVTDFPVPEGISCVQMGPDAPPGSDPIECFKEGMAPHAESPGEELFPDELDRAVDRLRLHSIGTGGARDTEPPADRALEDQPWPPDDIGDHHPGDLREDDWGRPRASDYLPRDEEGGRRARYRDRDDTYPTRVRQRLRDDLGEGTYRPNARRRSGGIIEETLP